jgi:phage terminase small subunit
MGAVMMLADERWEKFCQAIAGGEKATNAYLLAGFDTTPRTVAKANASRLLRNPKIKQRLGELQGWIDERISVTKEMFEEKLARQVEQQVGKIVADINWIMAQLVDAHEVAKLRNDIAGRCRALELLGKSRGHVCRQDRDQQRELRRQRCADERGGLGSKIRKRRKAAGCAGSTGTETKH